MIIAKPGSKNKYYITAIMDGSDCVKFTRIHHKAFPSISDEELVTKIIKDFIEANYSSIEGEFKLSDELASNALKTLSSDNNSMETEIKFKKDKRKRK